MNNTLRILAATVATFIASNTLFAGDIEELRSAVDSSDWDAAQALGKSLTAEDSENGEAFYLLGKALGGLEKKAEAVDAFKKANSLVKGNADYLADYGYALIMSAQDMNMFQAGPTYMRAMDQYKAAVKADPDHLAAHIGLSRYYMNAPAIGGGSMKKAKNHAAEIARINPYMGHLEHALIAQKENRTEDAESGFTAALAMKDEEAWVHFELGKLQQMSNKMLEAKASYEKAVELDPNHEGAKAALSAF